MRIIQGAKAARTSLLRRTPWDWGNLPEWVRTRLRSEAAFGETLSPQEFIERVFAEVSSRGDEALLDIMERLDGVRPHGLEVPRGAWARAYAELSPVLRAALTLAAERVRSFHEPFAPGRAPEQPEGAALRLRPVERAGLHVPGFTVPLPSTLLMTAIPALVAGVEEVVVTTPPQRNGDVHPVTLAAAHLAGVHRLFRVGGAQAVAALALGTESIPRVDLIAGPGNVFVQLAKRRAFGLVGIDGLYGPSETIIIADEEANPAWCAADLLAQAEHDPLATAICITVAPALAQAIAQQLEEQLAKLPRAGEVQAALEGQGGIIIVEDLQEAFDLANEFAPEHLCLALRHAAAWLPAVRHAGAIFLGGETPESLGDYLVGPSHILPTGGSARFASVLGVSHFLKASVLFSLNPSLLAALGPAAIVLAEAEGLTAHAHAIRSRLPPPASLAP